MSENPTAGSAFANPQVVLQQLEDQAKNRHDELKQPSSVRVHFEHEGIDYSIRKDGVYDSEVVRFISTDPERALKKLLGAAKWREFERQHTVVDEVDGETYVVIYGDMDAEPKPPIARLMKAVERAVDPTARR